MSSKSRWTPVRACGWPQLVPHAVLASQDPLNNLNHRLMLVWRLRSGVRSLLFGCSGRIADIAPEVWGTN